VKKERHELVLPEEYAKPMMEMLGRFSERRLSPEAVTSPSLVAVAIAIVIVLSHRPAEELELTDEEKAALKFAVEEIRADPEKVRRVTGIDVTTVQAKMMEALAL